MGVGKVGVDQMGVGQMVPNRFQNRGYNSSWEDIRLKSGYNLSGEGVHFMSRGGAAWQHNCM